ncbi:MAG TPA: hypothetical protein VK835_01490 [Bacteroidia bacterium]|jgi:hypothetical protein|nr:hypothetical protein [Bacteroidia bacterium]
MGFSISLKAQSNLAKPLFLKTNSSSFLSLPEKENNISMFLPSIKHTAFFCVMEDKVYSKLNVWIKLRAGSDEIYRKMIATP